MSAPCGDGPGCGESVIPRGGAELVVAVDEGGVVGVQRGVPFLQGGVVVVQGGVVGFQAEDAGDAARLTPSPMRVAMRRSRVMSWSL